MADDDIEKWLASIKGVICHTRVVKVYAPTCNGTCNDAVENLVVAVNRIFQGSTVYDAVGSWLDGKRLVTEPVKVIETGHQCLDEFEAKKLASAIATYATDAKQMAMAVNQGNFYLGNTPEMVQAFRERYRRTWK